MENRRSDNILRSAGKRKTHFPSVDTCLLWRKDGDSVHPRTRLVCNRLLYAGRSHHPMRSEIAIRVFMCVEHLAHMMKSKKNSVLLGVRILHASARRQYDIVRWHSYPLSDTKMGKRLRSVVHKSSISFVVHDSTTVVSHKCTISFGAVEVYRLDSDIY